MSPTTDPTRTDDHPAVSAVGPEERTLAYGPLTIAYDDGVLEPRPWTLEQARWGADLLTRPPEGPVAELCTGAGHIGLATVHGTDRHLVMVDADAHACGFAVRNAAAAGIVVEVRNAPIRTAFELEESFALITADPPWVPSAKVSGYAQDPPHAIDGGDDGLGIAVMCLDAMARHLAPDGNGLLQLGTRNQAEALLPRMTERGLVSADVRLCPGGVVVRVVRDATGAAPA